MLAKLAHALHDSHFREVVLRFAPREEILQEARRIESALAPHAGAASATPSGSS
jgi:hypothetical protein